MARASRTLAIAAGQFLLIAAAVVVLFWVLGKLWSILLPIVLGLLIATVLWPTTRFLRKHRWPPALAASTVLLAAVAILVGIIAAIAPSVADQVTELSDAATSALQDVQQWLQGPPFNFGEDQIGNAVDSVINSIQDNAQNIAGYALTGVSVVGNSLLNLVLALVLVFFFLKDGPALRARGSRRRPARGRPGTWRRCPTSPGTPCRSSSASRPSSVSSTPSSSASGCGSSACRW